MTLLLENARSSLGRIKSTIEVYFHDIPPLLCRIVLTRHTRRDPRVDDNDVQPPEVCCNPLHRLLYVMLFTDICLVCCSLDTVRGPNFCGDTFGVCGGFVDDSDLVVSFAFVKSLERIFTLAPASARALVTSRPIPRAPPKAC